MNDHNDHTADAGDPDRRGRGRGRGRHPGRHGRHGTGRGVGNGHKHRSRARRGAVGRSILVLLAEQPMHGYEMISALEERTGGAWKPSAGSMYPALERMREKGLIEPTTDADDDKQRYQLTNLGRRRVEEMQIAGVTEPWVEAAEIHGGDLRGATEELVGLARQIGRFARPETATSAKAIIDAATVELSRVLADDKQQRNSDGSDAPN